MRFNKRIITIMRPNRSMENAYINIITDIITSLGYEVIGLKESIHYISKRISVANLNWYEEIVAPNYLQMVLCLIKKISYIYFLKYCKHTKIIFTMHNKISHDHKWNKFSKNITDWMIRVSDRIVILNQTSYNYLSEIARESELKKVVLIPHPNYIGAYPSCAINDSFWSDVGNVNSHFSLLFFGQIRPYKNIELLIQLSDLIKSKSIHITIIGQGNNERYLDEIESKVKERENISFIRKHIPDEYILNVIKQFDCVVLPYEVDSVLNSGACMLTLSAGKNVICPKIGTMLEFPTDYTLLYEYKDSEEHLTKLYDRVVDAYSEFTSNRALFEQKERKLYEITLQSFSKEAIREKYEVLYRELCDGNF